MFDDGRLVIQRIGIDEAKAHTARAELIVQALDLGRVPIRYGAVGAEENQHRYRERIQHSNPVLNPRQIVAQGRRLCNEISALPRSIITFVWYASCSCGVQRLHEEVLIRTS